jgi:hypothetical protein
MLFLWMVGREMESMYGSREFAIFYLTAAVFSTLCWAIVDVLGPRSTQGFSGSMGAVTAVVVLYALYYPRREVMLFFVLPVEMWVLVLVFLGFDLLQLLGHLRGDGQGLGAASVGFVSHLGGALYGYIYKRFDLRWGEMWSRRARRPKFRVISPEPRDRVAPRTGASSSRSASAGARPSSSRPYPEEQLDARLDEILAKIAREGRAGLTEEENRILQEASRRARDRRSDH